MASSSVPEPVTTVRPAEPVEESAPSQAVQGRAWGITEEG